MAAGKKRYAIRKRDLKGNGVMWMDGKDGVYPHPVNERLLRGIKKSWKVEDYQVLGPWEMYLEWIENGSKQKEDGKTPIRTENQPIKEEAKEEKKEEGKKEVIAPNGTMPDYAKMKMAQLRELAKGKINAEELNKYKGVNGKTALVKRLKSL